MRLEELTVRRSSSIIRKVVFKRGLNLILDKPASAATESGNNVGKTTVLRLIDFCLGSDGDDIWQDLEFKRSINQEVYDFLHGDIPVSIALVVANDTGRKHELKRTFGVKNGTKATYFIDGKSYSSFGSYKGAVKEILFGQSGSKPTLRQLAPKFVRSSQALMSKTLKFLGDYASTAQYEALHLFLFGFFDVEVLEERPRLDAEHKKLNRDLEALNRLRNEGEIEQLLIHLRREIADITLSSELRGEVPEIADRANTVTTIRSAASVVAATLSGYESEIASLDSTIRELKSEYADIDQLAIAAIYREAQVYLPKLHHDWNDLTEFVQNLRGRKERFLEYQAQGLREKAYGARTQLELLQQQEMNELGTLVKSPEFVRSLELRTDLEEKWKRLGSLEQNLHDLRSIKTAISSIEERLQETSEKIEAGKALLSERVGLFNRYFSDLSKLWYGEQYLLAFDENKQGSLSFELTSVGSNVGSGKKVSQTAAFDVAYIKFINQANIKFPTFVCHDGVEGVHGNQLAALLSEANRLDGQLVLSVIRDKLPVMGEQFIETNTILELSQTDRFFRL